MRRAVILIVCALYFVSFSFEVCRAQANDTAVCGRDANNSLCKTSTDCCSQFGHCGSTNAFCGSGCQSGNCTVGVAPSQVGTCVLVNNQTFTCENNLCCSQYKFCGDGEDYCGVGCLGGPCSSGKKSLSVGVYAGIAVGVLAAALTVLLLLVFACRRRRRRLKALKSVTDGLSLSIGFGENSKLSFGGVKLSLETLRVATNGFSTELGRGAFGVVYKGTMKDQTRVAVKRLVNNERGLKDFEAEVKTLGSINHGNLVALLGYCFERNQPFLVYEFVANGSLDKWIFAGKDKADPDFVLPWKTRSDIARGTAKGLAYLHEDLQIGQAIIHLDVKPENILLNESFVPKVADFGMAKLLGSQKTQTVVSGGTIGYMAPEVYTGVASSKMDVYSFGIVLLEILSGQRHFDRSKLNDGFYLPAWAINKVALGEELDIVDWRLEDDQFDADEARRFILVALLCLQRDPDQRPEMGCVLRMMEGIIALDRLPRGLEADLEMTGRLIRRGMIEGLEDSNDSALANSGTTNEQKQRVGLGRNGKQDSTSSSEGPLLYESSSSEHSSVRQPESDLVFESTNTS